jgi:hypothetical protein
MTPFDNPAATKWSKLANLAITICCYGVSAGGFRSWLHIGAS